MQVVTKENPLSQLCCWASLCCRVWRNGHVGIAFFSPLKAEFSTWSSNLGLSCVCWVCLFSLWVVAAQDVRRKSRAPGDRLDVWYGIFLCVCWSRKSSIFFFFSTNTCSWVQGRKELVVQFHRHSKEEWSRARWQLQRKGDADPHQTGLMDSWLCSREAPRAPGSRITFASPDLLLYLNCIWSLSARSFHAHLQTSVFFPLNAF